MPEPEKHDLLSLFKEAADLHRGGRLAEAERLYLRLLGAAPGHYDTLQMLGFLRYEQGRLPEALSLLGAAVKVNSGSAAAHMNYAVVLDAQRRREEALAHYDQALRIKPDYAEAHFNRGIALLHLKRPAEALASFEALLSLNPRDVEALKQRGNALRSLSRPAEAVSSYEQALAVEPRDADALNARGNALRELDLSAQALESYDRALALAPDQFEVLNNRGSVLRSLQRPSEALADFDKAIAIREQDAGAHYNRGNALVDLKRAAEALASYDRALALQPRHVEALLGRAGVLCGLWRPAEALAAYDRVLALEPGRAKAWLGRADLLCDPKASGLRKHRSWGEILAGYDKALALEPDCVQALMGRGYVLNHKLGRHQDALAVYDRVLALEPNRAGAWLGRGEALERLRRPQEAIEAYRQALANGGDPDIVQVALATLGAAAAPRTLPKDFITRMFDDYADHFEDHLVSRLQYRVPEKIFEAVQRVGAAGNLDILDLGCGTGLVGALFRPLARRLVGVDISSVMIEVAGRRKVYDDLVCGELIEFLPTQPEAFDLVVATDVFIYVGDLAEVFRGVRKALREGGLFGFSTESCEEGDFALPPTRRYVHSRSYIERLGRECGFAQQLVERIVIREQDGDDAMGDLVILRCV
jgi:predicted TPR repeat methyltransferase